jgi:hypothetical protein
MQAVKHCPECPNNRTMTRMDVVFQLPVIKRSITGTATVVAHAPLAVTAYECINCGLMKMYREK